MKSIACLCLLMIAPALSASELTSYTKNVAIVIYNGVEILDFAGPSEVFEAASRYGSSNSAPAFRLYTVSRSKAPITSQNFLHVVPDYSIEDSPRPDIIILPGGGSQNVTNDEKWMQWVRSSARDAENVLTVCTGAFIAGRAGLLEGGEATTWYNAVPALAKEFPNTRVYPGRRFVDSGKVVTTAGVSAGIDGSLHLVARLLGRYVADRTAEYMEYKWSPESYLSSKYVLLNPRLDAHGRALQQASIATREGNADEAIRIYKSLITENAADAEAWLNLGRSLHGLKRYEDAIAANIEAVKGTAQRPIAYFNLACEYALTGDREKAIDAALKAFDAGFTQRYSYESDSDLVSIRQDERFKALLAKLKS